jgi:hypothetical protein
MKKTKLVIEYEYDFILLGLTSNLKEYRVAWAINKALNVRLVKKPDILIDFVGNQNIVISNFIFETEHSILRLLKNTSVENLASGKAYLLPELQHFDYFIMVQGEGDTFNVDQVIDHIRSIPEIQYLQKVDITNLKSKENLIF